MKQLACKSTASFLIVTCSLLHVFSLVWLYLFPNVSFLCQHKNKNGKKFTASYEDAKFLLNHFQISHQDNSKGINYNLTKPKEIFVVYSPHPTFHNYSSKIFPLQAKILHLLQVKRNRRIQDKIITQMIKWWKQKLTFHFFAL